MRASIVLGNLTIVTQPLNSSLSNSAWPSKQKELNEHSKLLLNARLIDEYPDVFDEAAIDARGAWLADRIINIWPGPDASGVVTHSSLEPDGVAVRSALTTTTRLLPRPATLGELRGHHPINSVPGGTPVPPAMRIGPTSCPSATCRSAAPGRARTNTPKSR